MKIKHIKKNTNLNIIYNCLAIIKRGEHYSFTVGPELEAVVLFDDSEPAFAVYEIINGRTQSIPCLEAADFSEAELLSAFNDSQTCPSCKKNIKACACTHGQNKWHRFKKRTLKDNQ